MRATSASVRLFCDRCGHECWRLSKRYERGRRVWVCDRCAREMDERRREGRR